MFIEVAVGIKAIVIVISLIGLFLGLFPEIDLWPSSHRTAVVVEAKPDIDNVWSALVYAPDDNTRDDIQQVHKEEQTTARLADNNATRAAMYATRQSSVASKLENSNRLLFWAIVGMCGIAFPLPKRATQEVAHVQ